MVESPTHIAWLSSAIVCRCSCAAGSDRDLGLLTTARNGVLCFAFLATGVARVRKEALGLLADLDFSYLPTDVSSAAQHRSLGCSGSPLSKSCAAWRAASASPALPQP